MSKAIVTFKSIKTHSQAIGGLDEHMIANIIFDVNIGSKFYRDKSLTIKQTVGDNYAEGSFEVMFSENYDGPPLNHSEVQKYAVQYYNNNIGTCGSPYRVGENSSSKIEECSFNKRPLEVEIELEKGSGGW
jgi:hypothetical protein